MSRQRFFLDVLPAPVWMTVIFIFSTHAGSATHTDSALNTFFARFFPHLWHRLTWPEIDALHYYVRKAAHVTEYAVLGVLVLRAFRAYQAVLPPRLIVFAWSLCAVYAATDEFHQVFVPGRTPKVTDVLLDAAGAALGISVACGVAGRKASRHLGGPTASARLEDLT